MRRAAQVAAVTVVFALLGLLVWDLAHTKGGRVVTELGKNRVVAAPAFDRPRVDTTGSLSLASLRGKAVVLNFWQSYCPPCTEEARTLADAARSWETKNVVFVGVDVQDLRGPARAFLERFDIDYPIVADGGSLVGRYGVVGYPETFFINRKGCAVPPHVIGPVTRKQLDAAIRKALRSTQSCEPTA